jgi:hypothetical protein
MESSDYTVAVYSGGSIGWASCSQVTGGSVVAHTTFATPLAPTMELAHDPDIGVVNALTLGPVALYLLAAGSTKLLRNMHIDPRDLCGLPRRSPTDS